MRHSRLCSCVHHGSKRSVEQAFNLLCSLLQGAAAVVEAVLHQLTAQQRALRHRRHQTWPKRTSNEEGLLTAADHRELLNVWQVKQLPSDLL